MTIEELRRSCEEKTYGDVEETSRRVFYTLADVSEGQPIRVAEAAQPTKLYFALHRQVMFLSFLADKNG